MPYAWEINPERIVVTTGELVPDFFNSLGVLQKQIQRYRDKPYGIKQLQRSCYNRPALIDFDTLPREIQEALGDPRKCAHIVEKWYKVDSGAVRFYPNFKFDNKAPLSQEHQEEYIINASVLKALREYKEAHESEHIKKGKKAKKVYAFLADEAVKFQSTLKVKFGVQHTLPSSERWFRKAYDDFFNGDDCDYRSLISGKLQNENAKKITDKLTSLLDSLFSKAGTKPSKLTVARRYQAFMEGMIDVVCNETGEMYNPSDFKPLSDRSITNWLSEWESKIATYSLRGADRQKLRTQFSVAHEMDRPTYAGSLISVDDRQPPFEYGPSQRVWIYNCLDVASDAITATVWGKSKEGMILDFYRQIVRNYTQWGVRLPAELEAETSLNSSYKDTFLREGAMFDYVRLEANNARGKIIENRNRQFRLKLEKEMEGWKGRPFARDEANQPVSQDNIYAEQKYRSYDSLVQQSLMTIEDWNNMPHPTQKEMTRWDYFLSMQHKQLQPTNWHAFLPHLGYATKSSCNVGKILLQGRRHMLGDNGEIFFGESLINIMKEVEGENVIVYWLDGNDGNLLKGLVYIGDSYICEVIPTPKYNRARIEQTAQDKINKQIQDKYTATVEGYMNRRKKDIEKVTVIDHTPKTLNRNFVMPGLDRFVSMETEAQVLQDAPEEDDFILPAQHSTTSILKNF